MSWTPGATSCHSCFSEKLSVRTGVKKEYKLLSLSLVVVVVKPTRKKIDAEYKGDVIVGS